MQLLEDENENNERRLIPIDMRGLSNTNKAIKFLEY